MKLFILGLLTVVVVLGISATGQSAPVFGTLSCSDPDSGNSPNTQSSTSVTDGPNSYSSPHSDSCGGNTLTEYYCIDASGNPTASSSKATEYETTNVNAGVNSVYSSSSVSCANGCSNGACLAAPADPCAGVTFGFAPSSIEVNSSFSFRITNNNPVAPDDAWGDITNATLSLPSGLSTSSSLFVDLTPSTVGLSHSWTNVFANSTGSYIPIVTLANSTGLCSLNQTINIVNPTSPNLSLTASLDSTQKLINIPYTLNVTASNIGNENATSVVVTVSASGSTITPTSRSINVLPNGSSQVLQFSIVSSSVATGLVLSITASYKDTSGVSLSDVTITKTVNITSTYNTTLSCSPFVLINSTKDKFKMSPKNQDGSLDNYIIEIKQFSTNFSYNVTFWNGTSIVNTISKTNVTNIDLKWNGTSNDTFLPDGEYNVTLNLYDSTQYRNSIDMGTVIIDNTQPTFTVQNSTPIITRKQNFTFSVNFSNDTLYWEINGQTRNGTTGFVNITFNGKNLVIPGESYSYGSLSTDIGVKQTILCGDIASSTTSSGGTSSPSKQPAEGYYNISITAYDDLRNFYNKIITVYIDLIDQPDESYIYQALKKSWNSFFLPRIVLNDIPTLKGNYSVPNVLKSIGNNYDILYYYNTSKWLSYSPNRPVNDLTEFVDNSNSPYWIKMKSNDTLVIRDYYEN